MKRNNKSRGAFSCGTLFPGCLSRVSVIQRWVGTALCHHREGERHEVVLCSPKQGSCSMASDHVSLHSLAVRRTNVCFEHDHKKINITKTPSH